MTTALSEIDSLSEIPSLLPVTPRNVSEELTPRDAENSICRTKMFIDDQLRGQFIADDYVLVTSELKITVPNIKMIILTKPTKANLVVNKKRG